MFTTTYCDECGVKFKKKFGHRVKLRTFYYDDAGHNWYCAAHRKPYDLIDYRAAFHNDTHSPEFFKSSNVLVSETGEPIVTKPPRGGSAGCRKPSNE